MISEELYPEDGKDTIRISEFFLPFGTGTLLGDMRDSRPEGWRPNFI